MQKAESRARPAADEGDVLSSPIQRRRPQRMTVVGFARELGRLVGAKLAEGIHQSAGHRTLLNRSSMTDQN